MTYSCEEDCIYFELCQFFEGKYYSPCDCNFFKDRSRFVELLCKVGDTVYCPRYSQFSEQWEIDEWVVTEISCVNYHLGYVFDSDGKWAVGDKENRIGIKLILSDKPEFAPDSICVPLKDFRDMFFPSREEAEQALKECEIND